MRTAQAVASIIRQAVAVAAVIMGPLTAAVSAIKLPAGVSAIITAGGAALLAIEHYVGDPSTGTPVTTTITTAPTTKPAVPGE